MADFIGTFAKFFTNLTHSQRFEIERAFADAENSKEITNLETSVRLLKRKVDQRLPIPQPVAREIIRGAEIEWDALPDQRVTFYEVDVSTDNLFSTFETFPTYGTLIVVDGLLQTKFVRVRGVRRDGTTTPYSETLTIAPTLFGVTSHTDESFYVDITGTDPNVVLGGSGSDLDYTPINENGNSKLWGSISTYADPAVGLFGLDRIFADLVVKKKDSLGLTISEEIIWRVTMGEFFNTHSIGPFIISHPELGNNVEVRLEVTDNTTLADGSSRSGDRTQVVYCHLSILELGV